jgi:hypothetical protein
MKPLFRYGLGLLLLTFVVQCYWGAYRSEFARHPDEAAHFITGLMVFDYLTTALGSNPMAFAEEYYVRYPKVAFGHWPPGFYLMQALWYLVVGTSLTAAMALVGLCASATAVLVWLRLQRVYGRWVPLLAAALFLCNPVTGRVMSCFLADVPATLFCLLAMFAFADYLQSNRLRPLLAFALWSGLAILTKGNALALGLLPPLAILVTGRWGVLGSWKLWMSAGIILALCFPFYHYSLSMTMNVAGGGAPSRGYVWTNLRYGVEQIPAMLGIGITVLAAWGAGNGLRQRPSGPNEVWRSLYLRVSLAWVAAVLLFHGISPIAGENRYLLPAIPACLVLFAEALFVIQGWLSQRFRARVAEVVSAALCLLLAGSLWVKPRIQVNGYRPAAEAIRDSLDGAVALIASDPRGEGAFVVERRLLDPYRTSYTLRASKVLAKDTWMGSNYQLRMQDVDAVRRYLVELPVHFIVLDEFGYRQSKPEPHCFLLRQTLESFPEDFILLHQCDAADQRRDYPRSIRVYGNRLARGGKPGTIRLELGHMLGREIELPGRPK